MGFWGEDHPGLIAGLWILGANNQPCQCRYWDALPVGGLPRRGASVAIHKLRFTDLSYPNADGTPRTYEFVVDAPADLSPIPTTGISLPFSTYDVQGLDNSNAVILGGGTLGLLRDSTPAMPKPHPDTGTPEFAISIGCNYRTAIAGAHLLNGVATGGTYDPYPTIVAERLSHSLAPVRGSAAPVYITEPDINPDEPDHRAAFAAAAAHFAALGCTCMSGPNEVGTEIGRTYLPIPGKALVARLAPLKAAMKSAAPAMGFVGPVGVTIGGFLGGHAAYEESGQADWLDDHWYNDFRARWGLTEPSANQFFGDAAAAGYPAHKILRGEVAEAINTNSWISRHDHHQAAVMAEMLYFESCGLPTVNQFPFSVQRHDGFGYSSKPEDRLQTNGHPSWYATDGGHPTAAAIQLTRMYAYTWRCGLGTRISMGEADNLKCRMVRYNYLNASGAGAYVLIANGLRTVRRLTRTGGTGSPVIRDAYGNNLTASTTADFVARTYVNNGDGTYDIELGPFPTWVEFVTGESWAPISTDTYLGERKVDVTTTFSSGTRFGVDPNRVNSPHGFDARRLGLPNNYTGPETDIVNASVRMSPPCSVLSPGRLGHVETIAHTFTSTPVRMATWHFPIGREETTCPRAGKIQRRLASSGAWVDWKTFDHPVTAYSRPGSSLDADNGYAYVVGLEAPMLLEYDDPDATPITGLRLVVQQVTWGSTPSPEVIAMAGPDQPPWDDNLGVTVTMFDLRPAGEGGPPQPPPPAVLGFLMAGAAG